MAEIALDADHRSMTKFESPDDENFKRMMRMVKRMVKKAPTKIAENWAKEEPKQGS